MEKLLIKSNGQWELESLEKTKKEDMPHYKWQKLMDSLPDDRKPTDDSPSEEHTPDNWGNKVEIDPKDVIHHDSDWPEDMNAAVANGELDYDYVRDSNGRVHRQFMAPDDSPWSHLDNKYLATNFHETDRHFFDGGSEEGSLTGAEKIGTIIKRPRTIN